MRVRAFNFFPSLRGRYDRSNLFIRLLRGVYPVFFGARNDAAICILSLFSLLASAQFTDKTFDAAFRSLIDGAAKVDSLNKLCRALEDDGKAIACGIKVSELAEKLNYKKGIAQAMNNIGVSYYNLDKGSLSLEYHRQALKIREVLLEQSKQGGNPDEIAKCKKDVFASHGNIGNTYDLLGDKKQAIIHFTEVLLLSEELKDTTAIARTYNNIARVYLDLPDYFQAIDFGFKAENLYNAINEKSNNLAEVLNNIGVGYDLLKEFDKALSYYQKALSIHQELGNQDEIARMLNNIANIYLQQGQQLKKDSILRTSKFRSALDNYLKSLDILEKKDDKSMTALVYNNIGNTYWELNDFPKALDALNKSLEIRKRVGIQSDITKSLNSLAKFFKVKKDYKKSAKYALDALAIADTINDPEQIKTASEILSDDYFAMKKFENSLFYYKRFSAVKDTLTNVEGAKKLAQDEEKRESEKREQKMKDEQEKERIKTEGEKRTQKLITYAVAAGLLLVVVFSIFILNRWRITQKQKKIIELQKAEVDTQRELADSRRIIAEEQKFVIEKQKTEVELQKKMVEEHQKEIISSITYAKRLQEAILPPMDFVKKYLPDTFILYKPKDIVAGDFYWMEVLSPHPPPEGGSKEGFGYETADPMLYKLLKEFVNKHRSVPTEAENIFWQLVREKSMDYKFRRQHIIGRYIADFVCLSQKLVVEIDGLMHELPENKTSDEDRTRYLNENGFRVIRFTNNEIIGNPDGVIKKVLHHLKLQSSLIPPSGGGGAVIFIAAADCTGHGVPGAMVSLVCSNALNRTVKEFGLRDTGKILDKVTELVLETFEKSGEDVKDGMDISLLSIKVKSQKSKEIQIQWSGANNPLWYIQNGELVELTADKQPIGKHDNRKPFTTHTMLPPSGGGGDLFYLFTDGYADQFGGGHGKKFKYKQLEDKLLEISSMPLEDQRAILDKTFTEWKGNLEQVDDVCIIGIRI